MPTGKASRRQRWNWGRSWLVQAGRPKEEPAASGLAASTGKIFVSYGPLNSAWNKPQPSGNTLLMLDAAAGTLLKHVPCENPGDLKVGADGKLYLVCGTTKIATVHAETGALTTMVDGLQGVRCVAADQDSNVYVGLGEPQNQVQVFDKTGKVVRTIGKPGGRNLLGPWEKRGIRFMTALKIDPRGKLWVMENDTKPRQDLRLGWHSGASRRSCLGPRITAPAAARSARAIPTP